MIDGHSLGWSSPSCARWPPDTTNSFFPSGEVAALRMFTPTGIAVVVRLWSAPALSSTTRSALVSTSAISSPRLKVGGDVAIGLDQYEDRPPQPATSAAAQSSRLVNARVESSGHGFAPPSDTLVLPWAQSTTLAPISNPVSVRA